MQAEKLSSTCSGFPRQSLCKPPCWELPGETRPLCSAVGVYNATGDTVRPGTVISYHSHLRCLYSYYGHIYSSPLYSEMESQPSGVPYRQPGEQPGSCCHTTAFQRHRGQPGLSHPTCACQSQHRKAALREKQPSSSPFTFVTSSASDQIPSFALETFQNSPNLCKFSVCLFLSL